MNRNLLLALIFSLMVMSLAQCTGDPASNPKYFTGVQSTVRAYETRVQASVSPSPTSSPRPSATPTSTRTPHPPSTPTITPTLLPLGAREIKADNAYALTLLYNKFTARVLDIAYSPGNTYLAAATEKGVTLFNRFNMQVLSEIDLDQAVQEMAFSPDEKQLAVVGAKDFGVVDVSTGNWVFRSRDDSASATAYLSSGALVAFGNTNGEIEIRKPAGDVIAILGAHQGSVNSLAFSPNRNWLASVSEDKTVRLWYAQSYTPAGMYPHHVQDVRSLAFSPDSALLASGSDDDHVMIYRVTAGGRAADLTFHRGEVYDMAFSPDGNLFFSAATDMRLCIMDVQNWKLVHTLVIKDDPLQSISLSPDGKLVALVGRKGVLQVWGLQN